MIYKETISPLKEVSSWIPDEDISKQNARRHWLKIHTMATAFGVNADKVDSRNMTGVELQLMYPGASSDIGSVDFEPAYFLLDQHRHSTFEVLMYMRYGLIKNSFVSKNTNALVFLIPYGAHYFAQF